MADMLHNQRFNKNKVAANSSTITNNTPGPPVKGGGKGREEEGRKGWGGREGRENNCSFSFHGSTA